MNIEFIRNFIDLQLGGIKDPESAQAGLAVLKIAENLLRQVQNDPAVFTVDPKDSAMKMLRMALNTCSSISGQVYQFSEQYSEPLAERAAKLRNTIDVQTAELSRVRKDCESIEKDAAELDALQTALEEANLILLNSREALVQRQNEYAELQEQVEALRKIEAEIPETLLDSMRAQIAAEEPEIQRRQEELAALRKRLTQLQSLTGLAPAIEGACAAAEDLHDLTAADAGIAADIIADGYLSRDAADPDSFFSRTEALNAQSAELQAEYDRLLKQVLDEAEALMKNIAARQEPGYREGDSI